MEAIVRPAGPAPTTATSTSSGIDRDRESAACDARSLSFIGLPPVPVKVLQRNVARLQTLEGVVVAFAGGRSWRIPDELTDGAGEFSGLILGDERVAVRDLDQPPLRKDLGQPAAVLRGHDAILRCP